MQDNFDKIYGYVLNILLKVLLISVSPIRKRVVIGCSSGKYFDGNSKRMFEVMYSQKRDVYFFTRDRKLYDKLRDVYNDKIVFSYSIKGLYVFLTSEIIILSHGVYDTTPFYPFQKFKKVANLWHGFPFKAIGTRVKGCSKLEIEKIVNVNKRTDLMISSSPIESQILSKSFGVDINNIHVTGYPRYDVLINHNSNIIDKLDLDKTKKIILYAPTFRDNTITSIFPFDDYSLNLLLTMLEELDAILLLRFHKNEKDRLREKVIFNDRIIDFDQAYLHEVNEILPFVDLLITDYSSIFMDFVILDKPMIFLPYDVNYYEQYRGLNFDWEDFYPGVIVFSFDDFCLNVRNLIMKPSIGGEKRRETISNYHQYEQGTSTKSVIDLIDNLN